MTDLNFGINNRLTVKIIREADYLKSHITLIRGHFAVKDDDCQTMGLKILIWLFLKHKKQSLRIFILKALFMLGTEIVEN